MGNLLPYIFISHSDDDNNFAHKLADDLRQAIGNNDAVWCSSRGGLRAGESYLPQIADELAKRRIFLVIASPSAVSSQWVLDEVGMAWHQRGSGEEKIIIPLLYRQATLPLFVAMLQAIDFKEPRPYQEALNELLTTLSEYGIRMGMETQQVPPTTIATQEFTQIEEAFRGEEWEKVVDIAKDLLAHESITFTSSIYRMLVLAYLQKGDIEQAQVALGAVFALQSGTKQRLHLLDECVNLLKKQAQWKEVLSYALTALQLSPNDPYWSGVRQEARDHLAQSDLDIRRDSGTEPPTLPPVGVASFAYKGHSRPIYDIAWSIDGQYIASASTDGIVRIWKWEESPSTLEESHSTLTSTCRHPKIVKSVSWFPDSQRMLIATGCNDGNVYLWDALSGEQKHVLKGHSDIVNTVAWSPDGKYLATASDDKTIRLWDGDKRKQIDVLKSHSGWVNTVAWSPIVEKRLLASGSSDATVHIWHLGERNPIQIYKKHTESVNSLVWSLSGEIIASASDDTTVHLWKVRTSEHHLIRGEHDTGEHPLTYSEHDTPVVGVTRSPHGRRIASGSREDMRVWYAATGHTIFSSSSHLDSNQVPNNRTHSGWVRAIAWSPNGRYIASAGDDTFVHIWSIIDEP